MSPESWVSSWLSWIPWLQLRCLPVFLAAIVGEFILNGSWVDGAIKSRLNSIASFLHIPLDNLCSVQLELGLLFYHIMYTTGTALYTGYFSISKSLLVQIDLKSSLAWNSQLDFDQKFSNWTPVRGECVDGWVVGYWLVEKSIELFGECSCRWFTTCLGHNKISRVQSIFFLGADSMLSTLSHSNRKRFPVYVRSKGLSNWTISLGAMTICHSAEGDEEEKSTGNDGHSPKSYSNLIMVILIMLMWATGEL